MKITEVKLDAGNPLWDKEFWQIDAALEVWFVSEVVYTITLALIKASILFLYTRIFPTRRFRQFVWATQVFNLMIVLGFVPVDFFQCRPLDYFWHSCEFLQTVPLTDLQYSIEDFGLNKEQGPKILKELASTSTPSHMHIQLSI